MYFKIFSLGLNTSNEILKYGFKENLKSKVSSFIGTEKEESWFSVENYTFDGSVWKEIELPTLNERSICFMRTPELEYEKLYKVYFNSKRTDDILGSISIILLKYSNELLGTINSINKNRLTFSEKKKLKKILGYSSAINDKKIFELIKKSIMNML